MTSEPNDKLRALFLSALMVMSVFAMTVAFAGTAAATNFGPSGADERLTSGAVFWQGQELWVDADAIAEVN
ncbi:MAG: surface glycoprotein, partial [Halobacteriales archaeon]|nr:surface glycoprotein [Halobacteriales archaeon]